VPLVWLVASVVAWMFTSASCVAVMEKWVWHDALYFVASTLTTVGYGDVVVKSSMGEWLGACETWCKLCAACVARCLQCAATHQHAH
jgi:hypothetical protein